MSDTIDRSVSDIILSVNRLITDGKIKGQLARDLEKLCAIAFTRSGPPIDIVKLAEQQAAHAPRDVAGLRALVAKWRTDADAAEYAIDRLGERFRERCETIAATRRLCAADLARLLDAEKEGGRW